MRLGADHVPPRSACQTLSHTHPSRTLTGWQISPDKCPSRQTEQIDNPFDPPSLKHTKVLRAEVADRQTSKANWTTVRQSLVEIALRQRGYNLRQLLEICPVNAQEGAKADEGYTHYEDLGLSIQGQDANHAWQAAAALAQALRIPVKVWFQWRTKPDAKFPGKRSLLAIDPLRS